MTTMTTLTLDGEWQLTSLNTPSITAPITCRETYTVHCWRLTSFLTLHGLQRNQGAVGGRARLADDT